MKRILLRAIIAIIILTAARAHAQANCQVPTPFNLGSGVSIQNCYGVAGNTVTNFSNLSVNNIPGIAPEGDAAIIFGYQCNPSSPECITPTSTTFLFVCADQSCATPITCFTQVYSAFLQTGISAALPNYAWYCPSFPSNTWNNFYLACSSTAPPTYTEANTCGFISGEILIFKGQCTASGSACNDKNANYPGTTQTTSQSATTAATSFTNELVCGLGGTTNDEKLTGTSGTFIADLGVPGSNPVYCKIAASTGPQTLGFDWTGQPADFGGMIMSTFLTAASVGPAPPTNLSVSAGQM